MRRTPSAAARQREKLATARATTGRVPVIAFVHSYGPCDDVASRFALAEGGPRWINRYGYLSDEKLRVLARR